jgi:hypothetical protein
MTVLALEAPHASLWWQLHPGTPLLANNLLDFIRTLAATRGRPPVCLEVHAQGGTVSYWLTTTGTYRGELVTAARYLLPGSRLVSREPDRPQVARAAQLRVSSRHRPLRTADPEAVVRALLASMTLARSNERLVLQLLIGPGMPAMVVPSSVSSGATAPLWRTALTGDVGTLDPEARMALRAKRALPGVRLVMRLGATALEAARQRQLLGGVLAGLRSAETPGVSLNLVPESARRLHVAAPPWRWPLALSADELVPLTGLPVVVRVDSSPQPGQPARHPRPLAPVTLAKAGDLVIGEATAPGVTGRIGYSVRDSRSHTWVVGPTGGGKSTLLLAIVQQFLAAGNGAVVIEPKDLITDLERRIPPERLGDVVRVDPLDLAPVGVNPLMPGGRPAELMADQVFALFDKLYGEALGPRSSDLLRQCLAVLCRREDSSLVHLALMLTNPGLRRSLTQHAMRDDPLVGGPFWARFEALSPEAQSLIVAPLGNKLRPLLTPYLRRIVGQLRPRISVRDVIQQGKVLLVPVQPGVVGPATAELLAGLVLSEVWQALQERVGMPERQRRPVAIVVDEVQHYLRLPTDLANALATSRGLGASFFLAHQYRAQLPAAMLAALDANARSRVAFQLAKADAAAFAAGDPTIDAEDFMALPAFNVYASLVRDGAVTPWASGRTVPPSPETSDPAAIRQRSREQFGQPLSEVEAGFATLLDASDVAPDEPVGGRRPRRTA